MKIYTGTGDTGETGLYGGQRVPKDDVRIEAYGTVDEVNALLGVAAISLESVPELHALILRLQNELFTVGADLATPLQRETQAGKSIVPRVTHAHAVALEELIDHYEAELEPLRQFIIPGGSPAAAALHHVRAVVRRAERCVVSLCQADSEGMNEEVIRYLNRIADLLFVLARVANHRAGIGDIPWTRTE